MLQAQQREPKKNLVEQALDNVGNAFVTVEKSVGSVGNVFGDHVGGFANATGEFFTAPFKSGPAHERAEPGKTPPPNQIDVEGAMTRRVIASPSSTGNLRSPVEEKSWANIAEQPVAPPSLDVGGDCATPDSSTSFRAWTAQSTPEPDEIRIVSTNYDELDMKHLGVTLLSQIQAVELGFQAHHVIVGKIDPGGTGVLSPGDRIVSINGVQMRSVDQTIEFFDSLPAEGDLRIGKIAFPPGFSRMGLQASAMPTPSEKSRRRDMRRERSWKSTRTVMVGGEGSPRKPPLPRSPTQRLVRQASSMGSSARNLLGEASARSLDAVDDMRGSIKEAKSVLYALRDVDSCSPLM